MSLYSLQSLCCCFLDPFKNELVKERLKQSEVFKNPSDWIHFWYLKLQNFRRWNK